MGSRRDQALVAGLVVLVALLAILGTGGSARDAGDPRPSTFRGAEPGALALFLALERLGIPAERRLTPWVDGEPLGGPLVLLAPAQPLTPREVESLVGWLFDGGTLVYAARPDDPLLEALGLAVAPLPAGADTAVLRARPHPWVGDVAGVAGFRAVFADTSRALDADHADILVAADDGRPAVVLLPAGAGSVLAWSDPAPLTNGRLRESGAAVLFARAAAEIARRHGALEFDEFHHGYREGAGPASAALAFLRDTGPGRMTLQWGVAGLGLLWLLGSRFGAPHPPPVRRRSPLEHVDALAGAYQQGGARTLARRGVLAGLARRLGQAPPAAGAEAAWLDRLAAGRPAAREAADALLAEWGRGARADLVALARHADRLTDLLRHPHAP